MAAHSHQGASQGGTPSRLRGAVNTVLTMSAGAGLALVGTYLVARGRRQADLVARLDRLEALLKDLEERGTSGG
jgi:hypothetical protein